MDYKLVVSSQQADLHRPTIKNSFLLLFYVNSLADLRRCWGNYSLSLLCDDGAVCTLDTGVSAPLSIYFYGMIQQLHNAVVAPTGMGKNYGRIMPLLRQKGKRLCIMVFWTMLLRMPLQPRGNIPIAANITFLEDSLGQYKKTSSISISRFLIKVSLDNNFCHLLVQELHNLRSTTHWSAKKLCNGKGGVPRLKCLKNGLRNFLIIP